MSGTNGIIAGIGDFGISQIKDEAVDAKDLAQQYAEDANEALESLAGVDFEGEYNITTNTPALTATPSPSLNNGKYYIINGSGAIGFSGANFSSGDIVLQGDKLIKKGSQWVLSKLGENIKNWNFDDEVSFKNYPFVRDSEPSKIALKGIIDIQLIGRDISKKYTLGILRRNAIVSGSARWEIRIYEWVNDDFGSQSIEFLRSSYTPSANIERILLKEDTTGIYGYIIVDWSKIPNGTDLYNMGYSVAGISQLCYRNFTGETTNTMLSTDVISKNYPFATVSNPNEPTKLALKNIRIYGANQSQKFTVAVIRKNATNGEGSNIWEVRIYEWVGDNFGDEYKWKVNNYAPSANSETIKLTSLYSNICCEVDIDWSVLADGIDLVGQNYSVAGVNTTCYRPSQLANNEGVVAIMLDSRTDQNDTCAVGVYNESETYSNKNEHGYMVWADALSSKEISWFGNNFGVSGDTTGLAIARLDLLLAKKPQIVIVWGGINDIAQGVDVATTTSNLTKIYNKLLSAGCKIIAVLDNFATNFTDAQIAKNRQINDWIKNYVSTHTNMYVVDADYVVTDFSQSTPTAKTGILSDTTHIGVRGAYQVGKQIAQILDKIVNVGKVKSVGARDSYHATRNPNQLLENLAFAGGGNVGTGASGTIPYRWTGKNNGTGATGVCSVGTSTEGFPEQTIVITANGNGDQFWFSQEDLVSKLDYDTRYIAEAEIEITNPVNLRCAGLHLECNVGSSSYTKGAMFWSGVDTGTLNESYVSFVRTPVLKSPTSGTKNWFLFAVRTWFAGSGGCTIKIRKVRLIKL